MSTTGESIAKVESDKERTILRPQRPPPPPPTSKPAQAEPSTSTEQITSSENIFENTIPLTEISNESNEDIKDDRPSLLVEFTNLFDSFDYEIVRNKILDREMVSSPFTTVLWRIFLHCLPRDSSHWDQIIDSSRANYDELVDKYLLDLKKIRENNMDGKHLNHPLSQEENSLWNQYYAYEEIKDNIYQDVIRTCQEISFFRQKHVLSLLLNVLYIHSRHYGKTLPYRQGMHEILAVVVYLINLESTTVNEYSESNTMMKKLYDPEYLAHDAYAIYEKIMDHLQPFYDFKPSNMNTRRYINMNTNKNLLFQRPTDVYVQLNDTVMRVNSIFERLKHYDLPLYDKLQNLSIEPTVYGIRWLRLLFGREIPFGSIPSLWTVIFCYDECFEFVDYFFLALLMDIGLKFQHHSSYEYSHCLQYLMQPNVVTDVETIIQNAINLEKRSNTKKFRRMSSNSSDHASTRSSTLETSKSMPSMQPFVQTSSVESIKPSLAGRIISSLQTSKPVPNGRQNGSEMADSPGKETRERFDCNLQTQKSCAEFMTKFINRMQDRVCELQLPNEEELLIQLSGLKQIANVLEGKLAFDDDSLQTFLNYQAKEKLTETNTNDVA